MKRVLLIFVLTVLFSLSAYAAEDVEESKPSLSGNLLISYSSAAGRFYAKYSGSSDLRGGTTYTWYRGSSSVSTSEQYKPSSSGSYYCTLTNDMYTGELSSGEITLFQAKGKGGEITFNNDLSQISKEGCLVSGKIWQAKAAMSST